VTKPPITAVSLVDFLRQMATVIGEIIKETETDNAPTQPKNNNKRVSLVSLEVE
jgi:formate hydrogenlyase subunit 6/NADH:ubiquinone oxidoreductase subunit I